MVARRTAKWSHLRNVRYRKKEKKESAFESHAKKRQEDRATTNLVGEDDLER